MKRLFALLVGGLVILAVPAHAASGSPSPSMQAVRLEVVDVNGRDVVLQMPLASVPSPGPGLVGLSEIVVAGSTVPAAGPWTGNG